MPARVAFPGASHPRLAAPFANERLPRLRGFERALSRAERDRATPCRRYCLGDRGFVPEYLETVGVDYGVKAVEYGDDQSVKIGFW